MALDSFIHEKIEGYAEKVKAGSQKLDEYALGELTFYLALRRVLAKKGTPQDLGMMDAINDVLQAKGIVKPRTTFLK